MELDFENCYNADNIDKVALVLVGVSGIEKNALVTGGQVHWTCDNRMFSKRI